MEKIRKKLMRFVDVPRFFVLIKLWSHVPVQIVLVIP